MQVNGIFVGPCKGSPKFTLVEVWILGPLKQFCLFWWYGLSGFSTVHIVRLILGINSSSFVNWILPFWPCLVLNCFRKKCSICSDLPTPQFQAASVYKVENYALALYWCICGVLMWLICGPIIIQWAVFLTRAFCEKRASLWQDVLKNLLVTLCWKEVFVSCVDFTGWQVDFG